MEKVEFVVVGGGLSGVATAMVLAEAGAEVIVVERGDYPGSKNVTGGRLYLGPVRKLLPEIWQDAPFERPVVKERLTMMAPNTAVSVELSSARYRDPTPPSFTLLHSTFDRWFADQATARGAIVIPGYKVDDLIMDQGRVLGIVSSGDQIHANAVVAADGVLSFTAIKAGLREKLVAPESAVAVKEVIELPSERIEDRFGIGPGEGAAQLFFGSLTDGVPGGGFIYTNRESLSLGLVLNLHDLMKKSGPKQIPNELPKSPHKLIEGFKARPEIAPLIKDGHPVEYSAHVIPEGGYRALPRLTMDGLIVVGDAAGLNLNLGVTVRGLDFAIASGVMAARTLLQARDKNDYSATSLRRYETILAESFVLRDIKTFQHMPAFLTNPRLYELYPSVMSDLMEEILWVGEKPKEKLSKTILRNVRQKLLSKEVMKDLLALRKV